MSTAFSLGIFRVLYYPEMMESLEWVNKTILKHLDEISKVGLFHGKMGVSIYLFKMARLTGDSLFEEKAYKLIEEIFADLGSRRVSCSFDNGLSGIVWGIEYLFRKRFIAADTDSILMEADDQIYKHLNKNDHKYLSIRNGLIGYGFYLLSKAKHRDHALKVRETLCRRLLIDSINRLYMIIEDSKEELTEPRSFNITWTLPWLLIFLSEVKKTNVYNLKTDRILEMLAPLVFSLIPHNPKNRFFLTIGIKAVAGIVDNDSWKAHLLVLEKELKAKSNICNFANKDVVIMNGMAGIGFLLTLEKGLFGDTPASKCYDSSIKNEIAKSEIWQDLEKKEKFKSNELGLAEGLTGIALSMQS